MASNRSKSAAGLAFVLFFSIAGSGIFALPKKPINVNLLDTGIQKLPPQKPRFQPFFYDDVNINATTPQGGARGIGAQRLVSVGVPYVLVFTSHPEMAGGNNHMRRQVKASGSGVVHMVNRVFDADIDNIVKTAAASRAKEGKAVIALLSTAKDGKISRISTYLDEGAGVVTSRADVHYVVSEFGIADLHGKTLKERAKALINIAHPKFREELEQGAKKRKLI